MFNQLFVGILFVFSLFSELHTVDANGGAERGVEMLIEMFKNIPPEVAPSGLNGEPLVVNHSISVVDFLGLENNVLVLNLWETMSWQDKRLRWSQEKYGVKEVVVPSRLLWQPDIILYNSVEEYNGFPSGDLNAIVYYDGTVTFVPPKITKSSCYSDPGAFARNEEEWCVLKFGSWTRSGSILNLEIGSSPEILYNFSPRFNMTTFTARKDEVKYQCCPETYISISYALSFLRI